MFVLNACLGFHRDEASSGVGVSVILVVLSSYDTQICVVVTFFLQCIRVLHRHLHSIGIVSILTDALGAFDSMDDAKHAGAASDLSSAADSKSPTLSQIHNLSCQVAYTFNWLCFNGGALLCTAVVESSRTVEGKYAL